MPTVSDIIAIKLQLDGSGLTMGGQAAVAEVARVKATLQQQGEQIERMVKGVGEDIATALKGLAGLAGIVFSFEGFKQIILQATEAGTSIGRFSEAVDVSAKNIGELEQAFQRAGGRSEEVRPVIAKMKSDIMAVRMGREQAEWMNMLGLGPFGMGGLQYRSPDDILLEVSRKAQGMPATQLGQFLPGLPLSPTNLAVMTRPGLLQGQLGAVGAAGTAPTPDQVGAALRLTEKFATLEQLNTAVLRDLVTITEPLLTSVIEFITGALSWLDGIERKLIGSSTPVTGTDEIGGMVGSRPGFGGYRPGGGGGGASGGPRFGGGGANYMRGALPGEGDLVTVQTAAGSIKVNMAAAADMKGFVDGMVAAGAPREEIGAYARRNIAGTSTPSQHAYGTAIDYGQQSRNVVSHRFREWATSHPTELRELLHKHNMVSGGDWRNPDFGHFEWRGLGATAGVTPAAGAASSFSSLQDQRSRFAKELAADPSLRSDFAAMIHSEQGGDPAAVAESIMNRASYTGGTLRGALYSGFYGSRGKWAGVGAADRSRMMGGIDAALAGSNLIKGATDQGSPGDPNAAWAGGRIVRQGEIFNDFGGGPGGHEGARRWREAQQAAIAAGVSPRSLLRMPSVTTGAAAAAGAPQPEHRTINNESSANINHIEVHTNGVDAASIAKDVKEEVGRQLAVPSFDERFTGASQ